MTLPKEKKITAEEFFAWIPESNSERYELWNGEIVAMASPSIQHQNIVLGLGSKIRAYIRKNKGDCQVFVSPVDVRLNDEVVVIPDVFVVCDPSKLDERRCYGAPDWVIEVVSTNRDDDIIRKLALYKDAGVREYWIVDPKNKKTLVYFFEKNDFPDIYTFETPIPVEVYQRQLSIAIAELL